MLLRLDLDLRQWGWKVPGLLLVLKACGLMRPITKGLACRVAAAAEHDHLAAAKTVRLAFHVDKFDCPFDAQRAVIADRYFRRWQLCPLMPGPPPGQGRDASRENEACTFMLILWHPWVDFIGPRQDATLQVPQFLETSGL